MNALRTAAALLLVCTLAPAFLGTGVLASPGNVLVARDRTEPVVAVDPSNPSVVVAAANTNYNNPVNGTLPLGEYRSGNGGQSFSAAAVPLVYPFTTAADPTVAIARDGTAFFSYLGEVPAFCEGGKGAIVVAHSIDHGRSFRSPVIADSSPADDKPMMAVESGTTNHLFLVWDRLYDHRSEVWFTRSRDGGAHFDRPRKLYGSTQDNYGPVPVVGPRGRIYVVWSTFPDQSQHRSTPTRIMMRSSSDDGSRFSAPRVVVRRFNAIPQITQPGSLRNLTMAAAVADSKGVLWLAWARPTAQFAGGRVNANIEIMRSTNEGRSWSQAVRVNDVTTGDRFMPAMTTWPDRSVGIAFYDRRRSMGLLDEYGARVWYQHGIHVSTNVRINAGNGPVSDIYYIAPGSTCFSPGRFFGDYIGVAAQPHGTLCAIWADTQMHRPGETDIWFARTKIPLRARP